MEMYAVMGATVDRLYNNIVEGCGDPRFGRIDAACTKAAKAKLKQLNASSITLLRSMEILLPIYVLRPCTRICQSMVFV